MTMENAERIQEIKDRLADRYTAAEIADILDIPVEDLIETFWDQIVKSRLLMEEVGVTEDDEDETT